MSAAARNYNWKMSVTKVTGMSFRNTKNYMLEKFKIILL